MLLAAHARNTRLAIICLACTAFACGDNLFDADRSANCGGPQCTPVKCSVDGGSWPNDWASLEEQSLDLLNQLRSAGASCGDEYFGRAPALTMNSALREAARCHSLDMATQNYFSHDSLDGTSPWTRIAASGYRGSAAAENIAAGYSDARSVVNGLMGSVGHCKNIMQAASNEIGIGFAKSSSASYRDYWTQDFGRR